MTDAPPRQWHRNPVAWLMIAIPVATVVAGFWTLWLAASESGVDTHPDKVRRTAQVQAAQMREDLTRAQLQALQAIRLIVGLPVQDELHLFDAHTLQWKSLAFRKDPACPVCSV